MSSLIFFRVHLQSMPSRVKMSFSSIIIRHLIQSLSNSKVINQVHKMNSYISIIAVHCCLLLIQNMICVGDMSIISCVDERCSFLQHLTIMNRLMAIAIMFSCFRFTQNISNGCRHKYIWWMDAYLFELVWSNRF